MDGPSFILGFAMGLLCVAVVWGWVGSFMRERAERRVDELEHQLLLAYDEYWKERDNG